MADIFVKELGDMLATNNLSDELGIQTLPSPNDLKRKILLKGKIKVKKKVTILGMIFMQSWRCSGLMVSAVDSGSHCQGLSPGRGHCVVFLGKTLYSFSASLHQLLLNLMLGVTL